MVAKEKRAGEVKKAEGFWEVWMPVGIKYGVPILRRIGRFHTKADAIRYWKAAQ
jgi:hypothetical protein